MKHSKPVLYLSVFIALPLVLSGCTGKSTIDEKLGSSVKHMVSQQTYEPGDEATGADGSKSRRVLGAYRKDITAPKEVEKKVININLD